jgi:hypothetical protein
MLQKNERPTAEEAEDHAEVAEDICVPLRKHLCPLRLKNVS